MPGSGLVTAARNYETLTKQQEEAKVRFFEALVDATGEGWKIVDVMRVTGLSRERIRQIRRQALERRAART